MQIPKSALRVAFYGSWLLTATSILIYLIIHFFYTDDAIVKLPQADRVQNVPTENLAIICMADRTSSFDEISINNKIQYARKHGYDIIWDFKPSVGYPKVWDKLNNTVHAALSQKYSWIWALDFDALITNTSIKLEDIIQNSLSFASKQESSSKKESEIEIIFTRDCEPVNLGSVLFRSSPWTINFIQTHWWSRYGTKCPQRGFEPLCNEQEILRDMLAENIGGIREKSVIVPQQWLDSYPEELNKCLDPRGGRTWRAGDFVVHFAGARWWLGDQMEDPVGNLMRKYAPFVV